MQFNSLITALTILALTTNYALLWTLIIYPETQDCTGDSHVKYTSDNTSPQCFVAGKPGEDVTCEVKSDDGKTWASCRDDALAADPDKLSFTIAKGNYCTWAAVGEYCAGDSSKSQGECLKGSEYGHGNNMRFQCANE
ncbi:hypothetical protein M409DRAFT_19951 [Zasmidium cellare ATCC 36951]|uniref:Secreted protein n=1 Tax=Zasmidium cellare ATCC 36951 TaxID=1080233 RepID=A0A6A6CUQ5_ZASCE|nr:uncharacterized protein M409DRAFT_19951 [Zasmidium cellare ATCC 36951]KAF2169539.1 hypothetical protein M409DRAFT_19951 [Zasmidium cellare ATCC 36951]